MFLLVCLVEIALQKRRPCSAGKTKVPRMQGEVEFIADGEGHDTPCGSRTGAWRYANKICGVRRIVRLMVAL